MRIEREREIKAIAIERERQTTTHQLQLIKGGIQQPVHASSTGTTSLAPTGRQDGAKNYKAVETLYRTMGENYVKEHIEELSTKYNITPRTIYRHLDAAIAANASVPSVG